MSIWTITSMNIPFGSIVEPPALAENCSIGFSSRQLPQSPERMMHLSRASGQRGQETAICSGYASQGDTPIIENGKGLENTNRSIRCGRFSSLN